MAHKGNIKGARKDLLLNRRWIVPTLPSEPTTSTWAWNDNGYTIMFRIGDQVRVEDENETSGYQFWKLYDIKSNGDRIWAPINSCSVAVHIFNVVENKYGSPNSAKGATISISSADDDRNLSFTWNGSSVSYILKSNSTYLVVPGAVQDYETPSSFTIITGNSDSGRITHNIFYNHRREHIYARLSKTNDSDIATVNVSSQGKGGTIESKNISTTSTAYTSLGYVAYSLTYYLHIAGSTFCWGGMLFSAYDTTLRTASGPSYYLDLPFTDERIDVIFKHKTSNGEVFFDPDEVEGYESKNIQIINIASSGSTYQKEDENPTTITENISPHAYGPPYQYRVTAIASDPRNASVLQYNLSKYLLPGKYVFVCSTNFAVTSNQYYNIGAYTSLVSRFYQLQSQVTKEISENDNVVEFTWNLAYTYLKVQSRHDRTSSIRVFRSDQGSSVDVTKTPVNRTIDVGMVPVPGAYSFRFADIPYTYKGVQTTLSCPNTSRLFDPSYTSKNTTVVGDYYSYTHTYCWDYTYSIDGNVVTIDIVTNNDQFGETLPSGYIRGINVDVYSRRIALFYIKYKEGDWRTATDQVTVLTTDFDSDNTCTVQHTVTGVTETLPITITEVSLNAITSYGGGGTMIDDNGERYYRHITHI